MKFVAFSVDHVVEFCKNNLAIFSFNSVLNVNFKFIEPEDMTNTKM